MSYFSIDDDGLVDRIRELVHQDTTDEELLAAVAEALKSATYGSALGSLIFNLADINLQSTIDGHEASLRQAIEAEVEAEYEAEFQRVEREYESDATYDFIEERFLSEPRFRGRLLNRIRRDKRVKSVKKYLRCSNTLKNCDTESILALLFEQHSRELLERFRGKSFRSSCKSIETDYAKKLRANLCRMKPICSP